MFALGVGKLSENRENSSCALIFLPKGYLGGVVSNRWLAIAEQPSFCCSSLEKKIAHHFGVLSSRICVPGKVLIAKCPKCNTFQAKIGHDQVLFSGIHIGKR